MFGLSQGVWADLVALLIVLSSISYSIVSKLGRKRVKVTLLWYYTELNFSIMIALLAWEMYPYITLKPEWATRSVFCAVAVHYGARFIQIVGSKFFNKIE